MILGRDRVKDKRGAKKRLQRGNAGLKASLRPVTGRRFLQPLSPARAAIKGMSGTAEQQPSRRNARIRFRRRKAIPTTPTPPKNIGRAAYASTRRSPPTSISVVFFGEVTFASSRSTTGPYHSGRGDRGAPPDRARPAPQGPQAPRNNAHGRGEIRSSAPALAPR